MRILAALCALLLVPSLLASQAADPFAALPSRTGLVVSSSDLASDLGASVLAKGGNAVDAAVATAFALAVTHPSAGNIGGGGFMVVRSPNGQATTFDYREKAPAKSTQTMYLGHDGSIDLSLTRSGYLAPGVPGTVSGLALGAQAVRQTSVEGRGAAGSGPGDLRLPPLGVARAEPEQRNRDGGRARTDAAFSRVGRGVRQAQRRAMDRGRPDLPHRSRQIDAGDRDGWP